MCARESYIIITTNDHS
jgi:hypothetical protein